MIEKSEVLMHGSEMLSAALVHSGLADEYVGSDTCSKYLQHYGVKGMKWGIRKAINKIKSNSPIAKRKARQKSIDADLKRIAGLSTNEINQENQRMQAINQYKNLKYGGNIDAQRSVNRKENAKKALKVAATLGTAYAISQFEKYPDKIAADRKAIADGIAYGREGTKAFKEVSKRLAKNQALYSMLEKADAARDKYKKASKWLKF